MRIVGNVIPRMLGVGKEESRRTAENPEIHVVSIHTNRSSLGSLMSEGPCFRLPLSVSTCKYVKW